MVKYDQTGRIVFPKTQEEVNKVVKNLIEELEKDGLNIKLVSVCLLRDLFKFKKLPSVNFNKNIKTVIKPFTLEVEPSIKYCSKGVLWFLDYNSLKTQEDRIKFVEASLKDFSKPIVQGMGYDWQDGIEILVSIGTPDALWVIKGLLNNELSKGERSDENIIAGLNLAIKQVNEISRIKVLTGQEKVREIKNLIFKYGDPNFLQIDSTKQSGRFARELQNGFIKELIRKLADEPEAVGNIALKEIWDSDFYFPMKYIIEDILLERNIITPDMKKIVRPRA